MFKVEVHIVAEELTAAILKLAATRETPLPVKTPKISQPTVVAEEPVVKPIKPSTEQVVTLEAVRAVLAGKSQAGKQAEVKALLAKYEVAKLTEIDPAHYPKLIQEAETL